MEIRELLDRLGEYKHIGENSYQCKCPSHDDTKPSLSVTEVYDKILVHCHAGCSTYDVLNSLGLRMADLYKEERQPEIWQEKIEGRMKKQIEASYHYHDENGKYLYTKFRFTGKDIRYGRISTDKSACDMRLERQKRVLYNLPATIRAIQEERLVYFAEGEKDVETLKEMGLTATTCGGVSDWKKEQAQIFTGANVVILPDNDDPGCALAETVKRDLRDYAHSIKVVITSREPKGDVTDYIRSEGHSREDLIQLVSEAEPIYAPWISVPKQGVMKVNEGLLAASIIKTLPYFVVRDRTTSNDDIYIFECGNYWKCGKNETKARIKKYLPAWLVKDSLLNAVYNLLMADESKRKQIEELNMDENVINVRNGLVNVKEMKLLPHSPDYLSTIQLACEFETEKRPEKFLQYLKDLCTHDGHVDQEQIAVIQEWTGLILSNISGYRVKKALCLYSSIGNTGKSILLRIWTAILGEELTINVPIQKLSDRFSMGDVFGKRLIAIGDQSGDDIQDSSAFKQLTGGDKVRVEMKGKTGFDYLFPGCMVMVCNDLPSFKDDKGGHIFERLEIMKCQNVIPVARRDAGLFDKIVPELSAIFMWGLEGLCRLIRNGYRFTESKANEETLREYRGMIDTFYAFILANCEVTGDNRHDRIKKTAFDDDYQKWCYQNDFRSLEKKNIGERAEKNGILVIKSNTYYYVGIRYKEDSPFYKGAEQQVL